MASRHLRQFTYSFISSVNASPSEESVIHFIDALVSYRQLDDLFISSPKRGMHASFTALEGLLTLPIRKICLQNIVANNELNNESLEWLTQSWPALEWFYCCNDDTRLTPGLMLPTPELFCHFAQNCPRLTHLYLTIDTAHAPVRPPGDALPHSNHPLFFHPHASRLARRGDLWRMLAYLLEIYPRLALHQSDDLAFSDPDTVEILNEVNSWIPDILARQAAGTPHGYWDAGVAERERRRWGLRPAPSGIQG
ncbi:hypothetical protein PsYK624_105340 [Phanerochaete sordida]|uniref:Uncharacterized protein n=1 Tax=Phanerochaete sordida TaxID=48140 RepID=A0A9P3GIQ5_9APHY|nr:hypothetical protein PsYK624_105340 [Phanerochaete sordida]